MRARFFLCLVVLLLVYSCKDSTQRVRTSEVVRVAQTDTQLRIRAGVLYYKQKPYTGLVYECYTPKDTALIATYREGLLDGVSRKWYRGAKPMEYREYVRGEKQGRQVAFWESGHKRFEFTAEHDYYEGELREWTYDGRLLHLAHFKKGWEEGEQKMWYDNGRIRANYVIIGGKRYGLLGTKNCTNVSSDLLVPPQP